MFCCVMYGSIAPGVRAGLGRSEAKAGNERVRASATPTKGCKNFIIEFFFSQVNLHRVSHISTARFPIIIIILRNNLDVIMA